MADSKDPDSASWTQHKDAFESKDYSKYYDPCQEAASRSIRCLHRNAGNKDLCSDFFLAYKDCKEAWTKERAEAKRRAKK